ncbi:hypothetical protein DB346_18950 [Verrucomicrobia bacterium LW23]|nr:hypothetical protein DB346_18950 [Verrucomicrobia bacterium LW23]
MKTTLEIDDDLYRQAKAAAALSGTEMDELVSEGLRLVLQKRRVAREPLPREKRNPRRLLGLLKREFAGRTSAEILDELRGPVEHDVAARVEAARIAEENAKGIGA